MAKLSGEYSPGGNEWVTHVEFDTPYRDRATYMLTAYARPARGSQIITAINLCALTVDQAIEYADGLRMATEWIKAKQAEIMGIVK